MPKPLHETHKSSASALGLSIASEKAIVSLNCPPLCLPRPWLYEFYLTTANSALRFRLGLLHPLFVSVCSDVARYLPLLCKGADITNGAYCRCTPQILPPNCLA